MTNIIIHQVSSCNVKPPRIGVTRQQRVDQRASDGYIDATALCKVANKRWESYHRLKSTKDYIDAIARETDIPVAQLIKTKKGKAGGTWVHPKVAVHLARWLSPGLAVDVSNWNEQFAAASESQLGDGASSPIDPHLVDTDLADTKYIDLDIEYIYSLRTQKQVFAVLCKDFREEYSEGWKEGWIMPTYPEIQVIHDLCWTAHRVKKENLHKYLKKKEIAEAAGVSESSLYNYASKVGGWDSFAALTCAANMLDETQLNFMMAKTPLRKPSYTSFFFGALIGSYSESGDNLSARCPKYPKKCDLHWRRLLWLNSWMTAVNILGIDEIEHPTVEKACLQRQIQEIKTDPQIAKMALEMILGCWEAEAFDAEATETESVENWDDRSVSAPEPITQAQLADPFEDWENLEELLPRHLMPNFGVLDGLPLAE